jgi:hypothetical protein
MSSSNDVYQRLVKLYNAGNLEALVDSYAEDAVLVTPDGTAQQRLPEPCFHSTTGTSPRPGPKVRETDAYLARSALPGCQGTASA